MNFANETQERHFMNILNTFSGTDGGIRFVNLRCFLEEISHQEDSAAQEIVDVMIRFSRLINAANEGN